MSKLVCGAPWSSANFSPQGFQLCCQHNRKHYPYATLEEWLASPELREFQAQMERGDYDDICRRCLAGGHNAGYGMYQPHGRPLRDGELWMVNFFMSRECNIACRTCSPHFSDTQSNFRRRLGLPHQPDVERPYKALQAVLEVNRRGARNAIIAGGDPVHASIYKEILTYLRKDIAISVVTNGQKWDDEFFRLVASFPENRVCWSIDGTQAVNEYMRTFAKSERIYEHLRRWIRLYDPTGVRTVIGCTLSNLSIWGLYELAQELRAETGAAFEQIEFSYTVVSFPHYFTPSNLPAHLRTEVRAKLQHDLDRAAELAPCGSMFYNSYVRICTEALRLVGLREFVPAEWTEFQRFNHTYDAALPPGTALRNLICE